VWLCCGHVGCEGEGVVEGLYGGALSFDSYAVIDVKRNVHRVSALPCDDGWGGVAERLRAIYMYAYGGMLRLVTILQFGR
jgi:hypothetical protein